MKIINYLIQSQAINNIYILSGKIARVLDKYPFEILTYVKDKRPKLS
ncbi:hypothetical protein ADICYQ_0138 [Cyclobacterium qasimii M12-11B]|uniref:Uncharacterized protein n=1 Tax=Cyclobacterium qasimii M12-11B TaxID=641524 RepID=S7VQQ3_9BACT|nr:hypothetical protein ADICYQ_0138 [Cyclobacterium qasimii M12-11B]